jgi:sugar transferase (PEP-CTERM system associated)
MSRGNAGFMSPEMALLGAVEFMLCLLVFYVLLLPGEQLAQGGPGVIAGIHVGTARHAAILAAAISATSLAIGLYRPEICLQTRRLLVNTVVAGLLAFPAVLLASVVVDIDLTFLFGQDAFWPMKIFLTWILLLFATRLAFRAALRLGLLSRNIVIVGATSQATRTAEAVQVLRKGFFRVSDVVEPDAVASLAPALLRARRTWALVLTADARSVLPVPILVAAREAGIRVYADVEFREQQLRRLDLEQLPAGWIAAAPGLTSSRGEQIVRRIGELAISGAMLVLTLPVLVTAAIAIRLDSPGPILYRQRRVGLNGQSFTLFKLRSMRTDAEAHGPIWAAKHDTRVTRVGAFLRRTRIDELPQLVNVIRGDMGFVGPRPERPHFVEQLTEIIPHYHDRARVKPGVTGWAQVNYPYGASIEDARQKLSYDLYYVKHRSLTLDLLIILATIRVILFQEGAR